MIWETEGEMYRKELGTNLIDRGCSMVKKIVKVIVMLVFLLLIIAGCTEFNGTIFDMIKVRQQAITYIHTKYHVPMEHIEAQIPDYAYGTLRYRIHVSDTKNGVPICCPSESGPIFDDIVRIIRHLWGHVQKTIIANSKSCGDS